ncbi:46 kDa FK506-binding nuclear protein-like isoform X1 [Temnothorax nylanderi]|uniref:46 kDa FK506-binding nuclear protein-like isoform X1 n=1 Tax=Temnothorax nylanderi TaxID=102681 RepID=UPI003A8787AA
MGVCVQVQAALLMQPHKKYTQLVQHSFHLTMASLDASKIIDDHPIQVMMIVGGNATRYLICTLDKTNVMQVPLNLHIERGTFITFLCNGGGYVHLSGYYKYKVVEDPDSKNIIPVHIEKGLTTSEELSDYIEKNITYQDDVYGGWIVQPIQQLNAINYQESEEKENSKRKANSPEDVAAKRMKSSANSNENRSNNDDNCDDTENSDDDDDDDDDYKSTSSDSDDDEIEIQESEEEDSQGQEKNGKQQEKEVTGEKANGKQKKKKKEEQEKNDTTLPGGLQVIQLKPGTGKIAEVGKHVTIYYLARVQIGSEMPQIDQCLKGRGLKFKLGAGIVLRGVDKGTVGMKVGEKRRLIIPPKMGYGSRGSGPTVPPHATLIYDVELIKVK